MKTTAKDVGCGDKFTFLANALWIVNCLAKFDPHHLGALDYSANYALLFCAAFLKRKTFFCAARLMGNSLKNGANSNLIYPNH